MSEPVTLWRDAAIGETREALVKRGRVIALRVARASDAGARARWGEVYAARIVSVDRRRRGAFVDLGLTGDAGFLPLDSAGKARLGKSDSCDVTDGQGVVVRVAREAARGKNPVLELAGAPHPGGAPQRLEQPQCDLDLAEAQPADAAMRENLDAAIEAALAREAPIPGGGALIIEPTAALVAIDVDSGARAGTGDAERFALELNIAAAEEAARQIAVRGLGGIVAIDFVSLRRAEDRARLVAAAKSAFAGDAWGVQIAGLSPFGVLELSRRQLRAPLHETLCDADGRLSVESLALAALRAVEREGGASPGRRIACTVAPAVKGWLDAWAFDWRAALDNRLGARWSLDAAPGPREKIDARAL
jgi:ribonuclease E